VHTQKCGHKNFYRKTLFLYFVLRVIKIFFRKLGTVSFWKNLEISKFLGKVFFLFIRFYRSTLSYFLGGNCRYYPSCSCYAEEAFLKLNFFLALKLVVVRLSKCHPLSRHSYYDPVPAQKFNS